MKKRELGKCLSSLFLYKLEENMELARIEQSFELEDEKLGSRMFEQHLFDDGTLDGYVQIMQIEKDKPIKVSSIKDSSCIVKKVEEFESNYNIYVTPNSLYIPKRGTRNIRQFRALYQDIDCEKKGISKDKAIYEIWDMFQKGEIPEPTMIVDSGRGLHLYWKIEHAPYAARRTWQELQDFLYHNLKHLGADRQATDAVRILRVPGTINSKNEAICEVVNVENELIYSMYKLREDYLDYEPCDYQIKWFIEKEHTQLKNTKEKECKVIKNKFFNSYSLHIARADDIETLCKLRKYDMRGYRNMVIHCYAYWKGIIIRNEEELAEVVYELNDKFKEPLLYSEIEAVLRCIPKAIDKFIEYEQGLRNKENKRISKQMKERGGYWYKNSTLIERFGITIEEQRQLETIIGKEVKYERNNDRRKKERRNEDGLTSREQQKQDLIKKIKELKDKGFKQIEISKELGISKGTVSKYLKL